MAYLLSQIEPNIVGILACGSGSKIYSKTQKTKDIKPSSSNYVYSLMGATCFNRTGAYISHTRYPEHYRLRFFKGAHVWADTHLIEQGMMRVVGQAILENPKLASYKASYLQELKGMIRKLKNDEPWESHYLAEFGMQIDKHFENGFFRKIISELEKDPRVEAAIEAEKDILTLCAAFYPEYDYFSGDLDPLPARKKMADGFAIKYTSIPHGEILTHLGQPSPGPKGAQSSKKK